MPIVILQLVTAPLPLPLVILSIQLMREVFINRSKHPVISHTASVTAPQVAPCFLCDTEILFHIGNDLNCLICRSDPYAPPCVLSSLKRMLTRTGSKVNPWAVPFTSECILLTLFYLISHLLEILVVIIWFVHLLNNLWKMVVSYFGFICSSLQYNLDVHLSCSHWTQNIILD